MKWLRSIASVLVSYLVVFVIVLGSDPVLMRLFPGRYVSGSVPPTFLLWISTAIFAAASVLGGWLCVRMAPGRLGTHLLVLLALGEVLGAITTVANWSKWPHWNSLVWLAIWPVCLWIGARTRLRSTPTPPLVSA